MKRIGIAGFGTIGRAVARHIENSDLPLALAAVSAGDRARAQAAMAQLARPVPIVDTSELVALSDVIVDSAPTAAFRDIAEATLCAGKTLVTVSGAALMQWPGAAGFARDHGGRIILATGALLGLDAVRAAAIGSIHSVTMVTRKPVKSLVKADHVVRNGIDLTEIDEPLKIFEGSAREGAIAFPANVNVAAALGLAGTGPDQTRLEIWADPALTRNTHRIVVDSDSARFELAIENIPTDENPGTGRITAQSIVAALHDLVSPIRIGT
ncbi:aspartate dehydrogenase [uncultured Sphingopyxis sp.]|jgi:aspartate dehydrogenase|uniref:aspartate dehydrogenase n=1 Tax=uncultured Sphingopyxis sp. TaxID=310581 RepID=UPI000B0B2D02|nr:aspartate dehydrogenase [uncultured Sphingopyxis sp.]